MEESYPNYENTMGKRKIARYEQFLLFPQCFQKACFLGASKGVIVWEWVKYTPCVYTVPQLGYQTILLQVKDLFPVYPV